jgi:hypothetical protein
MTKINYPCGCAEDRENDIFIPLISCPSCHEQTPPEDEPEPEEQE